MSIRAAGGASEEGLQHVEVGKVELREDDRGLIDARGRQGGAERGA